LRGTQSHFAAWLAVVLLFAVFGLFVWVMMVASPRGTDYEQKRAKAREEKLKAAHEETTKALTTYAWVDKNKGVARIPITDAMKLTMADLAQKQPAPAGPIAPESQVGGTQTTAPVTAPQASPAPSGSPSATPVSKGGHEPEANNDKGAAAVNPAPVKPGSQPGASSSPGAPPPPPSGQPNPAGAPQSQATATPHGTPLPVRGQTPKP
jgi:hypothetical protein